MIASPQKENGYTAIANEIMEALSKTRIAGEARQVLDFILRKTYGFNKKKDNISLSQFCLGTGLKKPNVVRSLRYLENINLIIVIKSDNENGNCYRFNKDFSTWKPIIKSDNSGNSVINIDNKSLSKVIPTKVDYTKTKDTIYISSQIENLLKSFSSSLREKTDKNLLGVALTNKSKKISPGRQLRLLLELSNVRERCADDKTFGEALDGAIKYKACNIGYVMAIIKNKKMKC